MKKILLSTSVIFLFGMSGMAQQKVAKKNQVIPKTTQPATKKVDENAARLEEKRAHFEALKAAERTSPKLSKDSKP